MTNIVNRLNSALQSASMSGIKVSAIYLTPEDMQELIASNDEGLSYKNNTRSFWFITLYEWNKGSGIWMELDNER